MAIEKSRSLRKASGGRLKPYRKSRQFAKVNQPILAKIGPNKVKSIRSAGANITQKLIAAQKISVADPKKQTVVMSEIQTVVSNQANKNYVQRNIINKGTVVRTKLGTVKITSRPGKTGTLSGILVE
jgi:small subunit ribosomal protein S8e